MFVINGITIIDKFLRGITAALVFYWNVQEHCHAHTFLYDTITYCFKSEQCKDAFHLLENFALNFQDIFVSVMQLLVINIVYFNPADIHELRVKYVGIGN